MLAAPHLGELFDGPARLLDVLQAARRTVEHGEPGERGVDVPRTVRIDPDPPLGTERLAHRLDALDLPRERLPGLGDLDLRGRAAPRGAHEGRGTRRRNHGDRDVDRDTVAHGRREAVVGGLARRAPPCHGLVVPVVPERGELAPPGLAAHEDTLPDVDAAEPGAQGDREDLHVSSLGRAVRSSARPRRRSPARLGPSRVLALLESCP